jgi:hypothetical protein
MGNNVIFFGWNRSLPGRENMSAEHFQDFLQYLQGLQKQGTIQSYDTVFLNPHGGDMNGFFLIRGESEQLDGVAASKEWQTHMLRATLHLESAGAVRGVTGEMVMERFGIWSSLLPS